MIRTIENEAQVDAAIQKLEQLLAERRIEKAQNTVTVEEILARR